jgi:RES domain-containing protein
MKHLFSVSTKPAAGHATALLEKLVHGSGALPPNQHFIAITIPRGLTYEVFSPSSAPGWDSSPSTTSKAFGESWQLDGRSLVLIVPSMVARPERNILINPVHPEFRLVTTTLYEPVYWDRRLFGA